MEPLPTSKQLQDAAKQARHEHVACQLHQLLMFGTNASAGHETEATLSQRTGDVCKILVEAWKECKELEDDLVDALWLQSCAMSAAFSNQAIHGEADALVQIIKAILQIPDRNSFHVKLQCNLLPSVLEAVGLVSEEELLKRLRIHNTQQNYKQQKYNLLQEETEGYAKVLHLLASPGPVDESEHLVRLRQIVGTFELDPNRIMDLMIDILEAKLYPNGVEKDATTTKPEKCKDAIRLLALLRHLSPEKLPALLAFKISAHAGASHAFLRTTAFLATEGLLDFEVMFKQFCVPIEKEIEEAHKILWMKEKRRVQALTRISLSGGTTTEDPQITSLNERLQKAVLPLTVNPIISILLIFLQWEEWERIRPLMSSHAWEHLCGLLPEKFGFAFCDLAQRRLFSLYKRRVGTPGLSKPWATENEKPNDEDCTIDDVIEAVYEPLLLVLHTGCIAARPILYCQLCRLLQSLLDQQETECNLGDTAYDFFKRFLVPSMSLFPSNPAISSSLWLVLRSLPYGTRYRLYEEWKGIGLESAGLSASPSSGKPLPIIESEINAGKAARYALKRLSKDNIRDMSRQLAKVTHCCPLVVFATILNQIESYDNMVEVMVEAQRFSNPLGLDVLGFCILSRLSGTSGGVNRSRLKEDGVNVSQWLQSLEAFSGAFFKRYPSVEFRGILAYLMRRLRTGHVMELGILGSLLKVAGGYGFADYSPAASLSSTQLEGRAGSFTLKRETMSFGIVEEVNPHKTEIIKHVLQKDGFGVAMLIMIAQARSRLLFQSSKGASKAVKLVGNLYDSCQVVISILLEFLTTEEPQDKENEMESTSAIEEYAKRLPPLDDLHFRFGLNVESSWMLARPLIRSVVQKKESQEAPDPTLVVTQTYSFRKKYERMLPDDAWSHLSQSLFESFYTNSLYDVFCPEEVYASELNRVSKEVERLERAKAGGPTGVQVGANPPKNEAVELSRLNKVMNLLTSDKDHQKQHVASVQEELDEKKHAFMNSEIVSQEAAKSFLLYCVYPRSLETPDDAMYCAHFAFLLHSIETPGFSTLHYIDELISVASGALFGLTEAEAANLAILLWQTWARVNKWRYEEGLYETEVAGKPGSYMQQDSAGGDGENEAPREVLHKEFVGLYNCWHSALGRALIGCLTSSEYMHMRTGLVILTRIVEVFPTRPGLGNKLINTLKPLQDENSDRPDIRASANAYCTMLLRARDDGKWVEEDAAVAQARADQEKAAARERKKKLEEQFEELQRDSEKITEEIGPRDDFERRRDQRGGFGGPRASAPPASQSDRGRGVTPHGRETGEVTGGDARDVPDRRSPPRDTDRRRERDADRGSERVHTSTASSRVGERQTSDRNRRDGGGDRTRDGGGGERAVRSDDRGGAGRWARGETVPIPDSARATSSSSRAPKRGRGPSPEPGMEDRGSSKRARIEPESNNETRREAAREASPPRRARPATESSRSSRTRRRR